MKQSYFLGGTSPIGFKSKFINQIKKPEYFTYILKGGPGTGKSTLMKKIAAACEDEDCELYYCSSDIRSLDAVVLKERKIIVVDGTSPHTYDPEFPAVAQEIVNLGNFWDKSSLMPHKDVIRYYSEENAKYHIRAKRYINAAAPLCQGIFSTAADAVLKEKLDTFVSRLSSKIFTSSKNSGKPVTEYKQLSAFTSYGYITRELADEYTIYTLRDDYFAGSDYFIRKMAESANSRGISVVISECNAFEYQVCEHLLIPELKIAFISSNFLNKLKYENSAAINFGRFYNKTVISQKKAHISFEKKAASEIYDAAFEAIDTALSIHDELEKFYISSLDTEKLNKFSEEFIDDIL